MRMSEVATIIEEIRQQNKIIMEWLEPLRGLPARFVKLEEDVQQLIEDMQIVKMTLKQHSKDIAEIKIMLKQHSEDIAELKSRPNAVGA